MEIEGNKIKLVQVIADSKIGGGPTHVLSLLRNFDTERFDCHLICPKGYLVDEAEKIKSVKVSTIPFRSKFDLESIFKLKSELNKIQSSGDPFGPMIIHSHGPRAAFMTTISAPKGAILVYTEHIYDEHYRLKNPVNDFLQRSALRRQNRRMNVVIVVSNSVKTALVENSLAAAGKIVVIPNGIDLSKFEGLKAGKINAGHPIIGSISQLRPTKGFVYLVEAMAILKKKFPLISLEIIGEGSERDRLKLKIRELRLAHNVTLLGQKKDAYKYVKHWGVFVLPSLTEPFGIVILEAMASGVPVVASNVGGIKDIITNKKNGILVEAAKPKQIAKAVEEILLHPVLAAKLKREGKTRARDFSWKDIVKKIEEVYISLFEEDK